MLRHPGGITEMTVKRFDSGLPMPRRKKQRSPVELPPTSEPLEEEPKGRPGLVDYVRAFCDGCIAQMHEIEARPR